MTPVVVLPAMGVPARLYGRLAAALGERGHTVATVALPGDEGTPRPSRRHDAGYGDLVDGPVAAAVDAARAPAGEPVLLVGHSLGGQLALLYAARHPDAVAGVALPAAGTNHWRAFPRATGLRFLAITQAAGVLATVLGHWPGDRLGFGGRQPPRVIRDWARMGRSGRLGAVVRGRDDAALAALRVPVLSLTLEGDTFAPPSAAAALLASVPAAATTRVHLPAAAFDGPVDHLRWLRDPAPVATAIHQWDAVPGPTPRTPSEGPSQSFDVAGGS